MKISELLNEAKQPKKLATAPHAASINATKSKTKNISEAKKLPYSIAVSGYTCIRNGFLKIRTKNREKVESYVNDNMEELDYEHVSGVLNENFEIRINNRKINIMTLGQDIQSPKKKITLPKGNYADVTYEYKGTWFAGYLPINREDQFDPRLLQAIISTDIDANFPVIIGFKYNGIACDLDENWETTGTDTIIDKIFTV